MVTHCRLSSCAAARLGLLACNVCSLISIWHICSSRSRGASGAMAPWPQFFSFCVWKYVTKTRPLPPAPDIGSWLKILHLGPPLCQSWIRYCIWPLSKFEHFYQGKRALYLLGNTVKNLHHLDLLRLTNKKKFTKIILHKNPYRLLTSNYLIFILFRYLIDTHI